MSLPKSFLNRDFTVSFFLKVKSGSRFFFQLCIWSSFQVNKYLNSFCLSLFPCLSFYSTIWIFFCMVSLWDFPSSKLYSKIFSLAFDDDIVEFLFQMRNILSCFLKKEIHYCLWLWLFDLRHKNVQTFSPHLLAKDQRSKLLLCKSRRINKKALDVEAGSNLRLLKCYWEHV